MPVTFAVQFEAPPFQEDRQVLGLLQFNDEHTSTDRVQDSRRHVDNVALFYIDSVEQAEQRVDVLAHDHWLEVIDGHVLLQTQVDLAPIDDEPGLRFAVRPAEVLSRERDVRMRMHGQALPGIQQFDE